MRPLRAHTQAGIDPPFTAPSAAGAVASEEADTGEGIAETGRLFLRNLAYSATEADLSVLLQPFGDLQEVHLVVDRCAPAAPTCPLPAPSRLPSTGGVVVLEHRSALCMCAGNMHS